MNKKMPMPDPSLAAREPALAWFHAQMTYFCAVCHRPRSIHGNGPLCESHRSDYAKYGGDVELYKWAFAKRLKFLLDQIGG